MVYESDFYTTRRPYRPSTYSASAELIYRPTARTVTRLVTYPEVPHQLVRVRVRPSVILRELDRISYRKRANVVSSAVDDFYRSEATRISSHRRPESCKICENQNLERWFFYCQFEDETRRIRADTASVLQRARSVVPRAKSVLPLDTIYSYSYGEPLPYRFSNDSYVSRLVLPFRSVYDTIKGMSYYSEPAKRFTGRGHLACVHYSGNKGFSSRRPLYKELSIRDDVNLLSFYAKNRLAAAGLALEKAAAGDAPEQPTAAQCA